MLKQENPLLIAFYLPQFHPIPENNIAWGNGFTEWNNVVKAKPKFRGHHQPQLPKDLGFYDLRLDDTRELQENIARDYGIDAFCYYSYWLEDKPILGHPLELEMGRNNSNLPICLCWANENWTRAWDGRDSDIILKQNYDYPSVENYCEYLIKLFQNQRYLRHNGIPVFLVYSPGEIPPAINFPKLLRARAQISGIRGVYLVAVKHGRSKHTGVDYLAMGYNQTLLFQPNKIDFPKPKNLSGDLKKFARNILPAKLFNMIRLKVNSYQNINYSEMSRQLMARPLKDFEIPCVFPSWDNSARRSISTIIQNDNPNEFGEWLATEMQKTQERKNQELKAVFINAWNEWAEGCHLEPDQKLGRAFLEQIASAKKNLGVKKHTPSVD